MLDPNDVATPRVTQRPPELLLDIDPPLPRQKGEAERLSVRPGLQDGQAASPPGLDQALQHATSELLRWLQEDERLDVTAASTLLGQAVRYEIGNVFNPAYTVAAKIAKRWVE